MNISIPASAQVKFSSSVEIAAPLAIVWQVLTDIKNWPSWQSNVSEAKLFGDSVEGTQFKWKAGGIKFDSRIHTAKPQSEFGWTGKTLGTAAVHNWYFSHKSGKTVVTVEECLTGILPRILRSYFQKNLKSGIAKNLSELKVAAENSSM